MYRFSGQALAEVTSRGQYLKLLSEWVAPSPGKALRRVADVFGIAPKPSGCNIEGIQQLRDALYEASSSRPEFLHAFLIVAPHTHWDSRNPVILSTDGSRYRIGPREIDLEEIYTPISFALAPECLCPYEWADSSIQFSEDELLPAIGMIEQVQKNVAANRWPLGISLNCRHKGLLDPPEESTLEYSEDSRQDDASAIYLLSDFVRQVGQSDYVQVGWHPYHDRSYGLSPTRTKLLQELRKMAEDLPESARAELRKALMVS